MKKSAPSSLTQKAMQALTGAVAKVVDEHRRRARPLAVWRDGKAVWISAAEAAALRESPTPYRTRAKKA
jgi:hypothetical protein